MPSLPPSHAQLLRQKAGMMTDAQRRGSAHSRGYDRRWQKRRGRFLQKNPLCKSCLGRGVVRAAGVVDHIIPHRGDKRLFDDETNWQSLCTTCHNTKTAMGG